ncbi:hypothetical protein [Clostridium butyricum]|uniref:hypothetical protein n=1 Tax=Clostridium butyricum TaxID=1492 RepID=UPI002ABE94CC|nr:hypothetical protein [Clostridium butyricum]
MTIAEKLKYIKENYGVEYTFIAKKIGTTYNRLYRFTLPKDNKNWRNLMPEQLKALNNYLNGFSFN